MHVFVSGARHHNTDGGGIQKFQKEGAAEIAARTQNKRNYERFLVLSTASRVAENRQIRKSTKEILRSEFRSNNKTDQLKFISKRYM